MAERKDRLLESNKNNEQDEETRSSKPKILCLQDGPYYLLNDMKPKVVKNLQNYNGEPLSTIPGFALCRCGSSNRKPFCDGSHSKIRFSTVNTSSGSRETSIKKKTRKDYVGRLITVHDNRSICSHAAECVEKLPSVFRFGSRPWIDPDEADVKEIVNTVRKCPSGALSYSIEGTEYRDNTDSKAMITVWKDGPYTITGGIELVDEGLDFGDASREHYTLCRCGASMNKPFCDGMHREIDFRDE